MWYQAYSDCTYSTILYRFLQFHCPPTVSDTICSTLVELLTERADMGRLYIFTNLNGDGKTTSLMLFEYSLYNLCSPGRFCIQGKTYLVQSAAASHLEIQKTYRKP